MLTINRGALAVAIGAASLIQPELVAGEVAVIGKMASDSAKKTVTTIATDTSSKVVKAISQDLADDAKEEKAKDVAAVAAKKAIEGGEKTEATPKDSTDPKATPAGSAKDAPSSSAPALSEAKLPSATDVTGKDPVVPTTEPSKETIKEVSVAAPDAQSTKPIQDISKDPKSPSPEPVKEATNGSAVETKVKAENPAVTKDRTIAIEVSQEPSKTVSSAESDASDSKPDPAPVSLKITLGADGEVKAVTKGGVEGKETTAAAAPIVETKTVPVEKTTTNSVVSAEAVKIEGTKAAPEVVAKLATVPKKNPAEVQEVPKVTDAQIPIDAISTPPTAATPQPLAILDKKPEETPKVSKASVSTPIDAKTPKAIEESSKPIGSAIKESDDASKAIEPSKAVEIGSKVADTPAETPSGRPTAAQKPPALWSPTVVSAVANVSTVTSTTNTKIISQPTNHDGMVTISQESLDLLHSSRSYLHHYHYTSSNTSAEIDSMQEAIQKITAVLTNHLPLPGTASKAIKSSEEEINEALASAVKPLSELLPEILNNNETAPALLEGASTTQPKLSTSEKRSSVLAVIGKVFWPFGGDKVAAVTVTEVDTQHSEHAEVVA